MERKAKMTAASKFRMGKMEEDKYSSKLSKLQLQKSSKDLISKRRPVTAIKNKVIEEQKPKPKVKYAKYGYFISREILVNRSKVTEKTTKTKLSDLSMNKKTPKDSIEDKKHEEIINKFKDTVLFCKDSIIAKDDTGPVNSFTFLSPAFKRFEETNEDEMHLSDMVVYSNIIYKKAKAECIPSRLIGPIKKFVTGIIMDFIDYKFLMTRVRYLNKSFIIFTQENCHYSFHMIRKAYMKVSLMEVYNGTIRIPMIYHPYYTNCTKLTLIYQLCKDKDSLCKDTSIEARFIKELFEDNLLFPLLNELKICVSHSTKSSYDCNKLSNHYNSVFQSKYLSCLEKLMINDTRCEVDWRAVQRMSSENFPNLKYLELPCNAFFDYDTSQEYSMQIFSGLHLNYISAADNDTTYYNLMKNRFYYKSSDSDNRNDIPNRFTLIGCNKLQMDVPKHCASYSDYMEFLNLIDQTNTFETDKYSYLRSLTKWHFNNMNLTDFLVNSIMNTDEMIKIRDVEIINKNPTDRTINDFRAYDFISFDTSFLDEFIVPNNKMSDHSLYILTHSSVFSHLRIIDFRGNCVKSLETLKVNYHLVILPSLKEFYVNCNVDSPEQSYNISFFFNGLIDRFTKLDVLWVEAKNNSLFVKKDKDDCIQPLAYSKLFLTNIAFEDEFGQEILDNLKCCEKLELRKCVFKKLAESDVYNGLCNLKHFALSDNLELFDDIFLDKQLFSTLKYLKVSNIKSKNVFKLISKLRVVGHLVLSNLNLSDQDYKPDVLFPVSLYKLEVVRCKVECMYLFDQLQPRKINIVDLTLFDNEYDVLTAYTKMIKSFSQTPNPKITRLVMDDLIFTMHSRATEPWKEILSCYPNLQDLLYNKNKRKNKIPKGATKHKKNTMTALINTINSGITSIRRFTQIQSLPDDYSSTVAPKIRGLFEYKYDAFSSVDDYN